MSKESKPIRFADRILARKWHTIIEDVERFEPFLVEALKSVPIIAIDNVYQYQRDLHKSGFALTDFPNVAPPFQRFWMEILNQRHGMDAGYLMESHSIDSLNEFRNYPDIEGEQDPAQRELAYMMLNKLTPEEKLEARWMTSILVFHSCGKYKWFPFASVVFPVGQRGQMMRGVKWATLKTIGDIYEKAGEDVDEHIQADLITPFLALGFMHCRNVSQVTEQPTPALSKAFQKRTGQPLIQYKTLAIDPMRSVMEREGGVSHNGLKRALHIVRGHFCTLTKNNKGELLPEPTNYFRNDHARGLASEGVVIKDYEIKAGG